MPLKHLLPHLNRSEGRDQNSRAAGSDRCSKSKRRGFWTRCPNAPKAKRSGAAWCANKTGDQVAFRGMERDARNVSGAAPPLHLSAPNGSCIKARSLPVEASGEFGPIKSTDKVDEKGIKPCAPRPQKPVRYGQLLVRCKPDKAKCPGRKGGWDIRRSACGAFVCW